MSPRTTFGALAAVVLMMATGCTSVVSGEATQSADAPGDDGVDVALMDTGPYRITPSAPFGSAGDDVVTQHLLEAQRMAQFVAGPWECDAALVTRDALLNTGMTGPMTDPAAMARVSVLPQPVIDAAAKHDFVVGFSSERVALRPDGDGDQMSLQNAVMRFPDPAAALEAAVEMAAVAPPPPGSPPGTVYSIGRYPDAIATAYDVPATGAVPPRGAVTIFTHRGSYVLYQEAHSLRGEPGSMAKSAKNLAEGCLGLQVNRIDQFVPTDVAAMADLPKDPTGRLLAMALVAPDNAMPFMVGGYDPRAWLHYEENPVTSTALFADASVEAVASRRDTVYEADTADGAARIVDRFVEDIGKRSSITPIDGVPGLPSARCFARTEALLPSTAPLSWQRVEPNFECVARADRYAYTTYSSSVADVKQQAAAQYRMLTGQ